MSRPRRNLARPVLAAAERAAFLGSAEVGKSEKPEHSVHSPRRQVRLTVNVDTELVDRIRNAAYWSREPLASIVTAALVAELARREKKRGEPFPAREGELRAGRPAKW